MKLIFVSSALDVLHGKYLVQFIYLEREKLSSRFGELIQRIFLRAFLWILLTYVMCIELAAHLVQNQFG